MSKNSSVETKKVRVELLSEMWELIERVGKLDDRTPSSVLRELSRGVLDALQKSNATVRLTPSWATAWEAMQQVAVENVLQHDSDAIDVSVLCTSRRTNSGFAGVYMHSNPARGFIAQGRDHETKKPGKHLGLFPTAVQAAWARYQHYRKHGMPYGKLEEVMDRLSQEPVWRGIPEHWIKAIAIHELAMHGTILPDLTPADRKWETNNPVPEMDC